MSPTNGRRALAWAMRQRVAFGGTFGLVSCQGKLMAPNGEWAELNLQSLHLNMGVVLGWRGWTGTAGPALRDLET